MFRDREDAAVQLARAFAGRKLHRPLVLAIPRGGVATGAALARALNAELDIVLSRKLRAPGYPEVAVGAISEDGQVYLNPATRTYLESFPDYLDEERRFQTREIARRKALFRSVRPQADVAGRTVIVTDDGIATGSTMIAALEALRGRRAKEVIVAVPVASPDRLREVERYCDEAVCLLTPDDFRAVGEYYEDFSAVEDDVVVSILRDFAPERAEE